MDTLSMSVGCPYQPGFTVLRKKKNRANTEDYTREGATKWRHRHTYHLTVLRHRTFCKFPWQQETSLNIWSFICEVVSLLLISSSIYQFKMFILGNKITFSCDLLQILLIWSNSQKFVAFILTMTSASCLSHLEEAVREKSWLTARALKWNTPFSSYS